MLKLVEIKKPEQKKSIIQKFDPNIQTWIVSDLRSKFELQDFVIKSQGFFEDQSILRASELWHKIGVQTFPDYQVLPVDFCEVYLRSQFTKLTNLKSNTVGTVLSYLEELMPVLSHPEGMEQLQEWFETEPNSRERWSSWAYAAQSVWNFFLEHKILTPQWLGGFLLNNSPSDLMWSRPLIIDLGCEMLQIEADLIWQLSQNQEVTVIMPSPEWSKKNPLLRPFDSLLARPHEKVKLEDEEQPTVAKKYFYQMPSALAEVKQAVHLCRSYLEQGIELKKMAIIAPDIELYWPVLHAYLDEEGIAYNKSIAHKLQSLPGVMTWIMKLRVLSGEFTRSDIELPIYRSEGSSFPRFEKFKSVFALIFDIEDLQRSNEVYEKFKSLPPSKEVLREEWLTWAIVQWQDMDKLESLELIVRDFLKSTLSGVELSSQEWLNYLAKTVSKKEFETQPATSNGLQVTSLMSAQSLSVSHRIFLGLSNKALRKRSKTQILGREMDSLALNLGFYLNHPDQHHREFELKWLADFNLNDVYMYPLTDFNGERQSLDLFWLEGYQSQENKSTKKIMSHLPGQTRWDELQSSDLKAQWPDYRNRSQFEAEDRMKAVKEDLGLLQRSKIQLKQKFRLSASTIEDYLSCPFIVEAKKILRLEDHFDIDLEIHATERGRILHSICERIVKDHLWEELNEALAFEMVHDIFNEQRILIAASELKNLFAKRLVVFALDFAKFESQRRKDFLKLKTVATEGKFNFYFNPLDSSTSLQESEAHPWHFSGIIDRIDQSADTGFFVIDYKSSKNNLKNYSNWLKDTQVQLAIYAYAAEKGLVEGVPAQPVVAAQYLVFKDLKFIGGFKDKSADTLLYDPTRSQNYIEANKKEGLLEAIWKQVNQVTEKISLGEFSANPKDLKTCQSCRWSRLCRAPHLN